MYPDQYIGRMRVTSATELRKNLAAELDRVGADHDYTIITRERGKPTAVLMSLEDFASCQETDYLLRSPANREVLLEAVAELEAGGGTARELIG